MGQVHQEQIFAVETSQNVVGGSTLQEQMIIQKIPEVQVDERIQEQIVETTKVVAQERVQQRTVEQIVDVCVPQVQERSVELVKVILQERVSERIGEKIVDVPVLHSLGTELTVKNTFLHNKELEGGTHQDHDLGKTQLPR